MCESRGAREAEGNSMEEHSTSTSYGPNETNKRSKDILKNLPVNYSSDCWERRNDMKVGTQVDQISGDTCSSPVSPFSSSFKGPYGVPLEYGVPFEGENPLVAHLLVSGHSCEHEFESKPTAFGWVSSIMLFPLGILCLFIFTTNRCIHCKVHKDSLYL